MKAFRLMMNPWLPVGAILFQASGANHCQRGEGKLIFRVCSVLVTAVLAASVMFLSNAVHAAELPSVVQTAAQLDLLSELNPQAYKDAISATEEYEVDTETGIDLSRVPQSVVSTLNPVIWAAMIDHADATARDLAGNDPDGIGGLLRADGTEAEVLGIGPLLKAAIQFVKTNWPVIKKKVVNHYKWAWYKTHRCIGGATTAVFQVIGFTTDRNILIGAAVGGCIARL